MNAITPNPLTKGEIQWRSDLQALIESTKWLRAIIEAARAGHITPLEQRLYLKDWKRHDIKRLKGGEG